MPKIDIHSLGSFSAARATTYERPVDDPHWELIWMAEGDSTLIAAETSYSLPPHGVALAPPKLPLVFEWDTQRPSVGGYITFSGDPGSAQWPLVRRLAADDVVIALLHHLIWLDATPNQHWREQAEEGLTYALRAYESGASGTSHLGDRLLPEAITRSMALVRERWSSGAPRRAPSLDELAQAAAVTREHLCRVYLKEIGHGPIAALRLLRLGHAAALLTRTNMSVTQIAHESGFASPFHFSRSFKQVHGLSPTEYRQRNPSGAIMPEPARRLALYL